MSWWTHVDFCYLESEEGDSPQLDVAGVLLELESVVAAMRYHPNVAKVLTQLLATGHADFKIISFGIIPLLSKLAEKFPQIRFAARGRGEAMRDVWVREYSDGKETFAFGPPEDLPY